MKNNFALRTALGLAALLAGFAACGKSEAPGGGGPSGAGGAKSAPPAKLAAVVLRPTPAAASVSATGSVLAEREVEIKTEIAGKVARIGFQEGARVASGQILLKLDDAELRAQAEKAAARLFLAQAEEKRLKEQVDAQAVSQREYDLARAELQTARAEAALSQSQLEKCTLRAPFAGAVGLRLVELGSVVQAGTLVTTVQDLSAFRVEFTVPERQAASVAGGMTVRFSVAGLPDTQSAVIYALEPRIDPETRLLRVRARARKPKGNLLPGAYARVELPLAADTSLWVPTQAVVQSAAGSQVWLARGGKAELRIFTPGLRTPEAVEAADLSPGDTVLVSGLLQLRPGAPVAPVVQP
jgi:membrane fusion protein (multidrug efflux system)